MKLTKSDIWYYIKNLLGSFLWFTIVFPVLWKDSREFLIAQSIYVEYAFKYSFLILLLFIAIAWKIFKTTKMLPTLAFIFTYPAIIIGGAALKLRGYYPNTFLAVIFNALLSVNKAKHLILWWLVYFTVVYISFNEGNSVILTACLYIILILLGIHYWIRMRGVFLPQIGAERLRRILGDSWNTFKKIYLESGESQSDSLSRVIAFRLLCNWILKQVRLQRERHYILGVALLKVFVTIFLTIVSFIVVYRTTHQLFPESFTWVDNPGIMYFIYISFSTFLTVTIPSFTPVTDLGYFIFSLELLAGVFVLVFVFFVLATVIREQFSKDLGEISIIIENELISVVKYAKENGVLSGMKESDVEQQDWSSDEKSMVISLLHVENELVEKSLEIKKTK